LNQNMETADGLSAAVVSGTGDALPLQESRQSGKTKGRQNRQIAPRQVNQPNKSKQNIKDERKEGPLPSEGVDGSSNSDSAQKTTTQKTKSRPVMKQKPAQQQTSASVTDNATQKRSTQGSKAHKGGKTASSKPDNGRWWSKLRDIDPITLVPLSSLKEPPFELSVENSDVVHRFDSKSLSLYLLSTGNFVDPINRQEMTREDCLRLDAHLRQHGNGEHAKCTEMLDLQKRIHLRPDNHVANEAAMANLRREAGVIASHLFHYPSLRDEIAQRRDERRAVNVGGRGAGAVTVTDDDEQWQSTLPLEVEDDFPDMPLIRRRTREDDFPPIGGNGSAQQPIAAPRAPQPSVSWATVAETARTRTFQLPSQQSPPPSEVSETSSSTVSWRAAADRPKLNLVKLEASWMPSTEPTSRPQSIFGRAQPVDNSHIFSSSDKSYQTGTGLALSSTHDYLCPYSSKLLRAAKAFGLTWVGAQEKKFKEVVDSGTSRKVLQLEPMPEVRRRFLQELALRYWGLQVSEMDPEPHRFLQISATPVSFAPDIMIHKALTLFSELTSIESSSLGSSNGILLIGCPSTVTTQRVHDLMRDYLQARESEYDIFMLEGIRSDEKNAFVEVSSSERARKLYRKLAQAPPQGFRCRKYEWWPAGLEWAKQQIRFVQNAHEDELEPLRAQRRLDEKRQREELLAKSGDTAWEAGSDVPDSKIDALRAKLAEQVDWDEDEVVEKGSHDAENSDVDSDDESD